MHEKIEKIKLHVIKYKTVYISMAVGAASAGFTYLIMRGRHADVLSASDTADTSVFVRPLSIFSKQETTTNLVNNVVKVIEREGRGHPGYLVRCIETNEFFTSQKQAAEAYGIPDAIFSLHIRGKLDDLNGKHFERLNTSSEVA